MRPLVLHILFDGPDPLASRMIAEHETEESGLDVRVVDFSSGRMSPEALVDEIFRADKVFSWHS